MKYDSLPNKKSKRKVSDTSNDNQEYESSDYSSDNDDVTLGKKKSKHVEHISGLEKQVESLKKKNNELLELCHMMEMN